MTSAEKVAPVAPLPPKVLADKARSDYLPPSPPLVDPQVIPSFSLMTGNTFCLRPFLPLGGRLSHFLPFWRTITADSLVLSIVAHGFQILLPRVPPPTGVRATVLREGEDVLLEEVEGLCEKAAIVQVPLSQRGQGFYSTYFIVPKKDGGVRPILNLKPFNKYLPKQHFKMETLQGILPSLSKGLWLASLDLKDAYFHIPMHRDTWKFLRFSIAGRQFQYRVLPFGLSPAPLVFTRVVQALISHLRERGVRIHAYLDDLLVLETNPLRLSLILRVVVSTFVQAGFTINLKKSDLSPSQDLVYIGGRLRTDLGRVFLPTDRRLALIKAISAFAQVGSLRRVRVWLQILGLMAATIHTVRHARLRMRPIQMFLKSRWNSRSLDFRLVVTADIRRSLQWWLAEENLSQGLPFSPPQHTLVITTDASREGWGGHLSLGTRNLLFSGLWSLHEHRTHHINLLELWAVKLTLCRVASLVRGQVLRIECDNTTAVSYLNKQGGTRSRILCLEACEIHEWLISHEVTIEAIHRPGVDNHLADFLSRNRPDPVEWSLADHLCNALWQRWGLPQIDLFASPLNHKLPVWFSRLPCQEAAGTDALTHCWRGRRVYAFPPFNLIPRTLFKIKRDQVGPAILITPYWPKRTWFPLVMSMAVEPPWILPADPNPLSQVLPDRGTLFHPDPQTLRLAAWKLNAELGN